MNWPRLTGYALELLGAAALVYGAWLLWQPLGFIVAGGLIIAVAQVIGGRT